MTAFGKLIRTTAFRLTLVYLFLFALFAASLLGYFAWNTRRMITEQITETVNGELSELDQQYSREGIRGLVFAIENRAMRPGANLYLLTTPQGQAVAGNIGSLQPGVMSRTGWANTVYHRLDENDSKNHFALVRVTQLSGGFRLLIGRDLEERQRLFGIVAKAAQWSVATTESEPDWRPAQRLSWCCLERKGGDMTRRAAWSQSLLKYSVSSSVRCWVSGSP